MPDFDTAHIRRGTGSLKWDKRPDLQPFWVADMDFKSPPAVADALLRRVEHGIFGYPVPHAGLEEAILAYLERRHHTAVPPAQIVHLGGLVPALSLAGRAFAESGDALMTCTPVYPPFLGIHRDGALELITVPHVLDGDRWIFDWQAMEDAVTPRTRLFVLSNPQNPLGRVFSEAEVVQLGEFCARHDLILISDEIHCDLIYDDDATPFFSALRLPVDLAARSVVLLSPSKTYNIAGLGYAYAVIPDQAHRRRFTQARGHTLAEINCLAYYAAEAAYQHGEPWRRDLIAYLRGNRDLLTSFVRDELKTVIIPDMEATYLAWLDFRPRGIDEPASLLEKKAGVFLSEGRFFGEPGHARLNFGCSRSLLREALDAIASALT
ncbi:MAG: PatB family C-S lyase [Roseibacillus sp.]